MLNPMKVTDNSPNRTKNPNLSEKKTIYGMNANSLLARLEELKRWQVKQQERLLQQQTFRGDPVPEETPKKFNKTKNDDNVGNPVVVRVENPNRPKKPFLKRGTGLVRYKMTDEDRKRPYGKSIPVSRRKKGNVKVLVNKNVEEVKTDGDFNVKTDLSPLKIPDFDIKLNDEGKNSKVNEESLIKHTINSINEMAQLSNNSPERNDNYNTKQTEIETKEPSEDTLYERNVERELLIFEALEERMLNSSFSSTNSSILKILSSTPNKLKDLKLKNKKIKQEEEITSSECCSSESSSDYEEKTIENLEETSENNCCNEEGSESNTFDETSESEITLENEIEIKEFVTKSVNTEDFGIQNDLKLNRDDEILTEKLRELDREIQSFRVENAKLQRKKLELEKEENLFKKEKKEFEKYVMEEKIKIEFYLEDEKKKFAKEKFAFERYAKDVQSRTNRKEREEIAALKDEIANVREASKLKDTRNATSQARLRNQIKNYEKEVGNLKEELETLRKQNAKLNTTQKYNKRSADSKVLQEINKNLNKLTKEVKTQDRAETIPDENVREKVIVESPRSLEKKTEELVDENLVRTYREVFGENTTSLNDSKMSKTETILEDGGKEIKYSNGNVKTITADGNLVTMKYFNGDLKETKLLDGVIKYYYAENQSWHTTYADGSEIIEFIDGQTETKYKDGTYEIKLPDGIIKIINPDKSESMTYPDGTKVNISNSGDKEIVMPNGQKEVHTKEHMRREYLDGTIKILYPDGIQETRYSNGRIRIKDKTGNLLLDSHQENL